ncbi:MAG: cell division protein SepF [Candidatus Diapherotrites archaeon]|nr:cell division protein SepF [Candidatus Diapherotrites archaeon]
MVGFLKNISKRLGSTSEEADVDEYLDTLGLESDFLQEEADVWVKPYVLQDVSDDSAIIADLHAGNVVLINIEPLYKRNTIKLKQVISELKSAVKKLDGDMVRLTEYKILVTPKGMKVAKSRK